MEKLLAILAAVLAMFSFSLVGFAKEATMGAFNWTEQNIGRPILLGSYTGEVIAIDRNAQSIVVKGNYGNKTFDVSKLAMKDIPELRDITTVEYTKMNGKRVASSVMSVPQEEANNIWWLHEKNV
jgi:hypothetical protein